jgi:hypothetical protein
MCDVKKRVRYLMLSTHPSKHMEIHPGAHLGVVKGEPNSLHVLILCSHNLVHWQSTSRLAKGFVYCPNRHQMEVCIFDIFTAEGNESISGRP